MATEREFRVGFGYDVHRLVAGRRCVLGGVEIPHELGLDGHSDADVALHALMDALLGAAALGDIGRHFPPGDPAYRDANSLDLLKQVVRLIGADRWSVVNVDLTVLAQRPKIMPHATEMRRQIANRLGIELDRVGIKATTNEGLGFVGREEGIAAYAVALLDRPTNRS